MWGLWDTIPETRNFLNVYPGGFNAVSYESTHEQTGPKGLLMSQRARNFILYSGRKERDEAGGIARYESTHELQGADRDINGTGGIARYKLTR